MTNSSLSRRNVASLALVSVSFSACCSLSELREKSADAYFSGDYEAARRYHDKAVACEKEENNAEQPLTWVLDTKNTPLLGLERLGLDLQAGELENVSVLAKSMENLQRSRSIDTTTEFLGISGVLGTTQAFLFGDIDTPFAPSNFEEISAQLYRMLANYLRGEAGISRVAAESVRTIRSGITGKVFLFPEQDAQSAVSDQTRSTRSVDDSAVAARNNDFIAALGTLPGSGTEVAVEGSVAGVSYVAGVIKEIESPDSALIEYQAAARGLPDSALCQAAVARLQSEGAVDRSRLGSRYITADGKQNGGLVHVFYLLGRGPELESTNWNFIDAGIDAEIASRLLIAGIGLLRAIAGESEFTTADAILQQVTSYPVPVPIVKPGTSSQLRSDFTHQAILQPMAGGAPINAPIERLTDYHALAQEYVESERTMRLVRALLRRGIKELLIQTQEDTGLQAILRLGSTFIEEGDDRLWSTLPAEFHATRILAPQGMCRLNLGYPSHVLPEVELKLSGFDAIVVVIDTGAPGVAPTVLVNKTARPNGNFPADFSKWPAAAAASAGAGLGALGRFMGGGGGAGLGESLGGSEDSADDGAAGNPLDGGAAEESSEDSAMDEPGNPLEGGDSAESGGNPLEGGASEGATGRGTRSSRGSRRR